MELTGGYKSFEALHLCALKILRHALFIPLQAQTYDPEGEYVAYWLPQLRSLLKEKRNFPGKSYMEQVVPLKFGNTSRQGNQDMVFSARKNNFGHRQTRGQRR